MITLKQLGDELRNLRARRRPRLTRSEAATIAGVSSRTWERVENGHYWPRLDSVLRLTEHQGVPISDVCGDAPPVAHTGTRVADDADQKE